MFSMREEILSLLAGKKTDKVTAFSGLIHVTAEGLKSEGLNFQEVHHDPQKMALAAASTFRLTGMPSATLPLDLCAPAEALGAPLNFFDGNEMRFPQVSRFIYQSAREFDMENSEILNKGRLGTICDAIGLLKKEIGEQVVISGMIPGPYTLLLYLCNPRNMFIEMKKDPQPVIDAVFHLSSLLLQIAILYRNAGADFITIHEMGGSPGFIGPTKFEQFVFSPLRQLITELPKSTVLSICGNTNKSMELIDRIGARAISVDQTNDLAASRIVLKDTLLFGNLDPVHTLAQGTSDEIRQEVRSALHAGVDAVWPGCDLALQTSAENLITFVTAS